MKTASELNKKIGARLKEVRDQLEMNQQQFGRLLGGLNHTDIHKREVGKASLKVRELALLAEHHPTLASYVAFGHEPGASTRPEKRPQQEVVLKIVVSGANVQVRAP
jgi:hypothetical protein